MQRELTITYTDDLIRRGAKRFLGRQLGPKAFIILAVLWAAGAYMYTDAYGGDPWLSGAVIGAAAVLTIIILSIHIYIPRRRIAAFSKLPNKEYLFSFTEDHLGITSPLGHVKTPWDTVDKLWKFTDTWLLIYKGGWFTTFPADRLDEELRVWLENKIKSNGGRVR